MSLPATVQPQHYDAFISYQHADKGFAVALEQFLEEYDPPRFLHIPRRRLCVFLDRHDTRAGELSEEILGALKRSSKLIVVCSPASRESPWVNLEIQTFADLHRVEHIVPILLGGIPNNEAGPDNADLLAFPAALCDVLEQPLAADFRRFDPKRPQRLDRGDLAPAWYTVLASLYGVSRDAIEQRLRRQRLRRLRITAAIVIAVVLSLATLAAVALWQRDVAQARQRAAMAMLEGQERPQVALLVLSRVIQNGTAVEEARQGLIDLVHRSGGRTVGQHATAVMDVDGLPGGSAWIAGDAGGSLLRWADGHRTVVARDLGSLRIARAQPGGDPFLAGGPQGLHLLAQGQGGPRRRISSGAYWSAAFSPTGDRVAAGQTDGTLRVWRANGLPVLRCLQAHDAKILSVAFARSGDRVATASADHTVKIWDPADPGCSPLVTVAHAGPVYEVAFDPSGIRIVTSSWDQTAVTWDAATGNRRQTLRGHDGTVLAARFDRTGAWVATGGRDRTVRLWDAATGEPVAVLRGHDAKVHRVVFDPDGGALVSASSDRTLRRWSLGAHRTWGLLVGHADWVHQARLLSKDRILTASSDGTARVWDRASGVLLHQVQFCAGGSTRCRVHVEVLDDDRVLLASSAGQVAVWTLGGRAPVPLGHAGAPIDVLALDPSGRWVATGLTDGTVVGWSLEAPGHRWTAAHPSGSGAVHVATFSPDGSWLVTGTRSGHVQVWNAETGSPVGPGPQRHDASVTDARFGGPTGQLIATASTDGWVYVTDLADPAHPKEREAFDHGGPVQQVAFAPDDQRLATGTRLGEIRLLDLTHRRPPEVLDSHDGYIWTLTFSHDGRYVVSGGADHAVHIEDTEGRSERLVLRGHTGPVLDVAVGPDLETVVSTAQDGDVRVWTLAPDALRAAACTLAGRELTDDEWARYFPGPRRDVCGG